MIFSIDHLVLAVSNEQKGSLVARLTTAGFSRRAFELDFPGIGAASESLGYAGGGMVEFVYERVRYGAIPIWFDRVPRVIGVGFASDDFVADTAWDEAGAWTMSEGHRLPDGSVVHIHAAGPHEHISPFYVFVMDRPDGRLQFPDLRSGPMLRGLEIAGRDAELWHARLKRWLRLEERAGQLVVGHTQINFRKSPHPHPQVSPTFVGADIAERVPLSDGTIELVPRVRA
jgi:hypothetical protein